MNTLFSRSSSIGILLPEQPKANTSNHGDRRDDQQGEEYAPEHTRVGVQIQALVEPNMNLIHFVVFIRLRYKVFHNYSPVDIWTQLKLYYTNKITLQQLF